MYSASEAMKVEQYTADGSFHVTKPRRGAIRFKTHEIFGEAMMKQLSAIAMNVVSGGARGMRTNLPLAADSVSIAWALVGTPIPPYLSASPAMPVAVPGTGKHTGPGYVIIDDPNTPLV